MVDNGDYDQDVSHLWNNNILIEWGNVDNWTMRTNEKQWPGCVFQWGLSVFGSHQRHDDHRAQSQYCDNRLPVKGLRSMDGKDVRCNLRALVAFINVWVPFVSTWRSMLYLEYQMNIINSIYQMRVQLNENWIFTILEQQAQVQRGLV